MQALDLDTTGHDCGSPAVSLVGDQVSDLHRLRALQGAQSEAERAKAVAAAKEAAKLESQVGMPP